MARSGSIATKKLSSLLSSDNGLPAMVGSLVQAGELSLSQITGADVFERHVAAELVEKALPLKYPAIFVYCDRISNELHEKFRTFSGTADLHIEIRVSHDHVEELQRQLQLYVEAVTDVLDQHRGSWSDGVFYTGGYEVSFQPVKRGGKNFLQTARVQIKTHLSVD